MTALIADTRAHRSHIDLLIAIGTLLLALLAGASLPYVPTLVAGGLVVVAAGILSLLVVRQVITSGSRWPRRQNRSLFHAAHQEAVRAERARTIPDYKLARWVFYAGLATLAELTLRPAAGLSLSDWLFFASIGLVLFESLRARRVYGLLLPSGLVLGMLLFSVGGILSSFRSVLPLVSMLVVVRLIYLTIAWFCLALIVLQKPSQIRIAVFWWIASAAVSGAAALAQLLLGDVVPTSSPTWGRMTGFTPHPNELGASMAVAVIPALALTLSGRGSARTFAAVCVVLISVGEFLSGSVSALMAATVGIAIWVACANLSLRLMAGLAVLSVVIGSLFLLVSDTPGTRSPVARLTEVTSRDEEDATLWSRVRVYQAGIGSIAKDPWIGVGLDLTSQKRIPSEFQIHNIILGPWVTGGIFGLFGILVVLGSILVVGRNVIQRSTGRLEYDLACALFAALVTFIAYALTSPALYTRYGWVPVALLLALRAYQSGTIAFLSFEIGPWRHRGSTAQSVTRRVDPQIQVPASDSGGHAGLAT